MSTVSSSRPLVGTLERWAWDYLDQSELPGKFVLDRPPSRCEEPGVSRRDRRPQRPRSLVIAADRAKTPGPEALRSPAKRARLVHTFLHHELQAAELMCWAILAYPESPALFRRGLAKIARDEVRHMRMYERYLRSLGYAFGDFPVRDWFWDRVPAAPTAAHFVATMGIGFEGGNLDHTARFAERFRSIGDRQGAELQDIVFEEEIPHVRFALRWFRALTGGDSFAAWVAHLPPPLSPMVMRGHPVERSGRARAGLSTPFIEELTQWRERESGS
ncbi:MAG TPA: DUF455 family protein [Polyangiaceae bacterium]|nr:DUF455 family protein [Polyangiaceae bacterium]